MTIELSAPFKPFIGAGGVLTVSTGLIDVAVYWELVSWDPDTETEGVAYGSLKYSKNKTDKAGFATNVYIAPTNPALVGLIDRVKVKCGEAFDVDFISFSVSPSTSPSKSPSLSASISPSEEAPPENEVFVYHFDGTLEDTGDYGIILNVYYGSTGISTSPSSSPSPSSGDPSASPSLSPSLSPSIPPFTFTNGIGKAGSAIVMDGTFGFVTEPSPNLYAYVGNGCYLLEAIFNLDESYNENWAWWLFPGRRSSYNNLPSLILEWWDDELWVYFENEEGYMWMEAGPLTKGNWYHIIAQFDCISSQERVYGYLYVNGVEISNDWNYQPESLPEGDPDNRFDIGYYEWYPSDGTHFKGKLDLCRMLTNVQPWSEEEVAARYAALLAGA